MTVGNKKEMIKMQIKHTKTASPENKVNCEDWNSDHQIVEGVSISDLANLGVIGYVPITDEINISNVSSYSFDNLNGNNDKGYFLEATLVMSATSGDQFIKLQPNGADTNCESERHFYGSSNNYQGFNYFYIGNNGGGVEYKIRIMAYLDASTGDVRFLHGKNIGYQVSNRANRWTIDFGGEWVDTTTNITSLKIQTTAGTLTGKMRLYKKI